MDDNSHRPLLDLSVQNVANFLQTVVVVDDKAHLEPLPTNNDNTSTSGTAEADNESPVGAHANLVSPQPDTAGSLADPEDLDAKSLVDGFAEKGIACTVLRPASEDDVVTQTTKITELADIVVLDWILDNDGGDTATSLIQKMISMESGSDRIRLIAIYTGERDLREVADKVSKVLSTRFGEVPDRPSAFVAVKGPVRLAVFGKPQTQLPHEDTLLFKRRVATSELPDRLIHEFAEMTTGFTTQCGHRGTQPNSSSDTQIADHVLLFVGPGLLGSPTIAF